MVENSSLIIIILELVLYLTTATSSSLFEPIADDVRDAIAHLDLPEETKVALTKHDVNVGHYPTDLIELLNSYMTIKASPVRFDDDELRILTSTGADVSVNDKILAQLKYFRKVQEVQCTDYVILLYKLYGTERNAKQVAKHVYNMIAMAYEGKAVVPGWLWKLHVNLWEPTGWDHEVPSLELMDGVVRDLEQFRAPLTYAVDMCVKHEYTSDLLNLKNPVYPMVYSAFAKDRIGPCYDFNNEKHTRYRANKPALPLAVDHLFLINVWPITYHQSLVYEPIAYVTLKWYLLANAFKFDFRNVQKQFTDTRDWPNDPFRHITFQQTFMDVVRVRLYCFIWVQLFGYQKFQGSNYKYGHDKFIQLIADIVKLVYTEDHTLNRVLTFYSSKNIGKPDNNQQIEDILKIITNEVNNILKKLIKYPNQTALTDISNVGVDHDIMYISFMKKIEAQCEIFGKTLKGVLKGLTFDVLLFFINGSKNTDFTVFPEN